MLGHLGALGEAEDLEAAAVGENRPRPLHELVQAAKLGDDFITRAKQQVIGIGQTRSARRFRARDAQCRRLSTVPSVPNRHEGRQFDRCRAACACAIRFCGAQTEPVCMIDAAEAQAETSRVGTLGHLARTFIVPSVRTNLQNSPILNLAQSPRSFKLLSVSFSRTSLKLVTPKFLHSNRSSPVRRTKLADGGESQPNHALAGTYREIQIGDRTIEQGPLVVAERTRVVAGLFFPPLGGKLAQVPVPWKRAFRESPPARSRRSSCWKAGPARRSRSGRPGS